MIRGRFAQNHFDRIRHRNADLIQNVLRRFTYIILVDAIDFFGRTCAAFGNLAFFGGHDHFFERFALLFINQVRAIALHVHHQLIRDRADSDDLFFRNARQVVVKRTSIDNILGRFGNVCCFINNHRRVACASADGFLAGRQDGFYHARSAGSHQHVDIGMVHHSISRLNGRIRYGRHEISRTACFNNGFVKKPNGPKRGILRRRMRAEENRIACGNHADAVANDGFRRVGGRRNGANHSVRSHFQQSQAVVSGPGDGLQILRTRAFHGCQLVFKNFVAYTAHAAFPYCHFRHGGGVGIGGIPYSLHELFPFHTRKLFQLFIRLAGGGNGFIHRIKNAVLHLLRVSFAALQ